MAVVIFPKFYMEILNFRILLIVLLRLIGTYTKVLAFKIIIYSQEKKTISE